MVPVKVLKFLLLFATLLIWVVAIAILQNDIVKSKEVVFYVASALSLVLAGPALGFPPQAFLQMFAISFALAVVFSLIFDKPVTYYLALGVVNLLIYGLGLLVSIALQPRSFLNDK